MKLLIHFKILNLLSNTRYTQYVRGLTGIILKCVFKLIEKKIKKMVVFCRELFLPNFGHVCKYLNG